MQQPTLKQQILLIEDERSIADNIRLFLEQNEFQVVWCNTYTDGIKKAQSQSWALIILDVGLPDGNGFSLCKELRKTSETPIVFLTARNEEIDKIVGFEFGADDYITKPFSPRELLMRLRAILRRKSAMPGAADKIKSFKIDSPKNKIYFRDQALDLTRYEFRLLQLFLAHPGHVYTREKLMELVWESPEMSLDRTVDAHIKTLRAKLHKIAPDKPIIETHRGLGYSLKETIDEH
ncbi:MAG: two-component system response regulator CreB [Bdellovibrionaceae bacterium]|nr:two-component system response regulator CreB [Pseudobdellovibrionaceae bacterium]